MAMVMPAAEVAQLESEFLERFNGMHANRQAQITMEIQAGTRVDVTMKPILGPAVALPDGGCMSRDEYVKTYHTFPNQIEDGIAPYPGQR